MELEQELRKTWAGYLTRRHFLHRCGLSAIGAALAGFRFDWGMGADGSARTPHFVPRAKRVIYLHMAGAPSQLELFDYKPTLHRLHGQECPESLLAGRRFAFIQGTPKMLGPQAAFAQHGQSGAWVSDRLPHFSQVVDEVTFLMAMHTDEFNHAPAQLLMLTGSPRPGRPSFGSWVVYGLGSENENLPGFVVLLSGKHQPDAGRAVWSSGFLPTVFEGVQCRSEGDPVLYVSDPEGLPRSLRRRTVEVINRINQRSYEEAGDPQILSRIQQYEMAFRMQMSVPESMDISQEPPEIHRMYGTEPGKTSFANNCLLARRLIERNVRFVQLFHWGWDSHGADKSEALNLGFKDRCREVDRPMAALISDLKRRGLLEDTLVVWAGEFGRTPMLENRSGMDNRFVGRDHHSDAFTVWLAGGGVRQGFTYGETDEIGYQGISGRVHVHDLQATVLHLLGMDHERLVHRFQGRDFRLTDVHGRVVEEILA